MRWQVTISAGYQRSHRPAQTNPYLESAEEVLVCGHLTTRRVVAPSSQVLRRSQRPWPSMRSTGGAPSQVASDFASPVNVPVVIRSPCYSPSWSPDGEQTVFTRSDGAGESIYLVKADGSGLVQLTDGEDDQPHWGTSVP